MACRLVAVKPLSEPKLECWIRTLGTNFSDILSEFIYFHSSAKWWRFCLRLTVLRNLHCLPTLRQKRPSLQRNNWSLGRYSQSSVPSFVCTCNFCHAIIRIFKDKEEITVLSQDSGLLLPKLIRPKYHEGFYSHDKVRQSYRYFQLYWMCLHRHRLDE